MCDPVSMATANQMRSALFIANETNKATNDYNQNLADNYTAGLTQMQTQRRQMGEQAQQQQSLIARKAQQEQARIAALALESGMTGNTEQRLHSTAAMATNDAQATTERNLNNALAQTQMQAEALRRQTMANFRQGVTWDGLNLQLQGIQLAGRAQNADLVMAQQAQAESTNKKRYGLPGSAFGSQ